MPVDKTILTKLRKFAKVFADARDREANESDTVMFLIEFFKDVLDYDPLSGEISKEVPVNDRYCDFGIRLDDKIAFLVEAKPAGVKVLKPKHIEQAENYASRACINWVLLTNGVMWQLYHLTFASGIDHELVFEVNLLDELENKPDYVWDLLSLLSKGNVREESLDTYYEQKKLLSPKNVVNLLVSEDVLMKVRQELNRKAPARLDLAAVFHAIVHVLSPEAVALAGDIAAPTKKKHHRKRRTDDASAAEGSPEDGDESDKETKAPELEQPKPNAQVLEKLPAVSQPLGVPATI